MDDTQVKKRPGRPKGSGNKAGLTLEKRLKILSKIALDKNSKPPDVIAACKEITALLNDKIKAQESEVPITQVKYTEDTPNQVKYTEDTPKTVIKSSENTGKNSEEVPENAPATVITDIIKPVEPVDNKEVTKEDNTINFNFVISEDLN